MRILGYLIVNTLAVVVSAKVVPGVRVDDWVTALVVAVLLGVVNTVLRPVLIFLTLPVTILTLGLFALVINAFLVILVSNLVPGFTIGGFGSAFLFSLILSLVGWFLNSLIG